MSYASLGRTGKCLSDEIWSEDSQKCVPLMCEAGEVAFYGLCLTPEEQRDVGATLCRSDEVWSEADMGCACKPGTTRQGVYGGTCYPIQSGASPTTSADVRMVGAEIGAPNVKYIAIGAIVAVAALGAYYYAR